MKIGSRGRDGDGCVPLLVPVEPYRIVLQSKFDKSGHESLMSQHQKASAGAAIALIGIHMPRVRWHVQALNGEKGFLSSDRLKKFSTHRNNPNQPDALSNLSPYYHFGHLAAQRAALEASKLRSKCKASACKPACPPV